MRKISICLIFLVFIAAACSDGESGFDVDPDVSAGTMEELTVTFYGAVNPTHSRTIITIDAARGIELTIEEYEDFDTFVHSCTAWAEITESEYEAVVGAVVAADVATYVPPTEEEGCEVQVGGQGYGVDYSTVEGGVFSFDTGLCVLDEEIENLIDVVMGLMDQYFTDCMYGDTEADETGNEKEDDEDDIVIYKIPLINPRDVPRIITK